MKNLKGLFSHLNNKVGLLMAVFTIFTPLQAMAAMPTAVSKGAGASAYTAGSGDWLQLLTGYFDSGTDLLAWAVAILGFIVLAVVTLGKFNDARKNKAEWSEVGLTAGVGAVILMFMVFLATEATAVI
jgi:integrating conjugative element membrane protein (TIGR03745 family)